MVYRVKGRGRALPAFTRPGWFYHHDGIYARKWPLSLCVYSVSQTLLAPTLYSVRTIFGQTFSSSLSPLLLKYNWKKGSKPFPPEPKHAGGVLPALHSMQAAQNARVCRTQFFSKIVKSLLALCSHGLSVQRSTENCYHGTIENTEDHSFLLSLQLAPAPPTPLLTN